MNHFSNSSTSIPIAPAGPPRPPPTTSPPTKRQPGKQRGSRQINTLACSACKARKTKCDGPPDPCEACLQRKTDCTYDARQDKRRKPARQQVADEAEVNKHFLDGLIEALRSAGDERVRELVGVIRSDASQDEIMARTDRIVDEIREKQGGWIEGASGGGLDAEASRGPKDFRKEPSSLQHTTKLSYKRRRVAGESDADSGGDGRDGSEGGGGSDDDGAAESEGSSQLAASRPVGRDQIMRIHALLEGLPLFDAPLQPWIIVPGAVATVTCLESNLPYKAANSPPTCTVVPLR